MDEECTVLTSYLTERRRAEGVPPGEALMGLYARRRTATSILLRGIEGSGRPSSREKPRALYAHLLRVSWERAGDSRSTRTLPNPHVIILYSQTLRARRTVSINVLSARTIGFGRVKFA